MNDTTYAESEADGESESPLPSERFTFTFAQGVKRLLWTAPLLTTVMALLLGGVFAVLAVCVAIGRGIPAAQLFAAVPKALLMFAVAWGLLALLCFPLTLIWCLTGRSRKIWVEGKQLHIQTGRSTETFDLEKCRWKAASGNFGYDSRGYYRGPDRPRVAVQYGKRAAGLGYTEESAAVWIEFLENAGVDQHPDVPWLLSLGWGLVAVVVGGATGLLIERVMPMLGGPAVPQGGLVFLGVLDGTLLITLYLGVRYGSSEMGRWLGICLMTSLYGGFAMKWVGVWQVAIGNAAIGVLLGFLFLPGKVEQEINFRSSQKYPGRRANLR